MRGLFYTDCTVQEVTTPYGYTELIGIDEAYTGVRLRGKVVVKFDVLSFLKDIFSPIVLEKYRNLVYNFISGKVKDVEKASLILNTLYQEDEVFRKYLGDIYYFSGDADYSLYENAVLDIKEKLRKSLSVLTDSAVLCGYRVLADSQMYLYCSFNDGYSLPAFQGIDIKVISGHRGWDGTFRVEVINSEV